MPSSLDIATILAHRGAQKHKAEAIDYDPTTSVKEKIDSLDSKLNETAGEPIGALKVVRGDSSDGKIYLADSSNQAHATAIIGISLTAASATDDPIQIAIGGPLVDLSWTWNTSAPIFFTSTGSLTQTPPTTGFSQQVATALSQTKIKIEIGQPVLIE